MTDITQKLQTDGFVKRLAEATKAIQEEADLWRMIATNLFSEHRKFYGGACSSQCARCAGEKDFAEYQERLRLGEGQ